MSDVMDGEIAHQGDSRRARGIGILSVVLAASALGLLAVAANDVQERRLVLGRHWLTKSPWWWVALALAVLALVAAVIARRAGRRGGEPWRLGSWTSAAFALLAVFVVGAALWTALVSSTSITVEGRPLRRRARGRRRAMPSNPSGLESATSTYSETVGDGLTDSERSIVHAYWKRTLENETEAISSFLQLEAELDALNAPRHLRARARAAADEMDHADLARAIAHRVGPGPSSSTERTRRFKVPHNAPRTSLGRRYRLLRLAMEAYADGCCNEGAEAIRLNIAAARTPNELSRVLQLVAAEEGSHAELGWSTIRWAIAEGGATIGWALSRVPLPRIRHRRDLVDGRLPALTEWGWTTADERARCAQAARATARARLRHLRQTPSERPVSATIG